MDDVTALRDALVNDAIWVNANRPKNVGEWRARLDALIAAVEARAALARPEEPRVERCAFEYETAEGMTTCGRVHDNPYHRHDPESPPHRPDGMCHSFTPEAR